jgi:endonuclease YncB( thermonuclease family)
MRKFGWVLAGIFLTLVILAQVFLAGLRYEKLDFVKVVDGDTFTVISRRDGQQWNVRLWGVNAPDSKECFYKEATKILEQELTRTKITYERQGYDGFGRILAKVYVNGVSLEESLVATGAAVAFDAAAVHDELKPSKEYVNSLKQIEAKAKAEKLGMWSKACVK